MICRHTAASVLVFVVTFSLWVLTAILGLLWGVIWTLFVFPGLRTSSQSLVSTKDPEFVPLLRKGPLILHRAKSKCLKPEAGHHGVKFELLVWCGLNR